MTLHTAKVRWARGDAPFDAKRYSRVHEWSFDGGMTVRASPSPSVVKPPLSDPAAVDPEEAFLAALSSCHMLWFLDLAARQGLVVEAYDDEPEGKLVHLEPGRQVLGEIRLRPRVTLGAPASSEALSALHEEAHRRCFLANALRAEIDVVPRP
jgi:organic hydroperoxide reductase OsmC/OhrA